LENVDYAILSQIFNEKHGLNEKLESVEDRNLTSILKEAREKGSKSRGQS
jgi:hypothetical protein